MPQSRYEPPQQSGAGQIFDSVLLLVLVYLALLAPLLLQPKAAQVEAEAQKDAPAATWQSLKQNEVQARAWQNLGHTPDSAKPIIESRFDYTINYVTLGLTIVVIVGYFVFVMRVSDREYREVIRERFGDNSTSSR